MGVYAKHCGRGYKYLSYLSIDDVGSLGMAIPNYLNDIQQVDYYFWTFISYIKSFVRTKEFFCTS